MIIETVDPRTRFTSPHWGEVGAKRRVRGAALTRDCNPSPDLLRKSTSPFWRGERTLPHQLKLISSGLIALFLFCSAPGSEAQTLVPYKIVGDGIPESLT